ncbi:uncharacterized protein LOC132036442 isoform X2 [Lycium ferocissimum]|uniref:uncharacterized protein LOC132036442 isoform X2 n=1 Tax=Lycium ferocissimum TaxID=112874 RepID=UPI002815AFD0|nr:uncharacterized protein LOC132036442 isoform X2 [Lycium ferocissimum]
MALHIVFDLHTALVDPIWLHARHLLRCLPRAPRCPHQVMLPHRASLGILPGLSGLRLVVLRRPLLARLHHITLHHLLNSMRLRVLTFEKVVLCLTLLMRMTYLEVWLPDKASTLLTDEIQKLFKDSPTWGQMSPNRQRRIYYAFKEKCYWRPEHEKQLTQNFKKKAQHLLCDMLGRVRKSHKKPKWILPENYNKLLHYWATDERFLQLSDIGKKERNSTKGGSLHTSGAMSQEAVRRKLASLH